MFGKKNNLFKKKTKYLFLVPTLGYFSPIAHRLASPEDIS